MILELSLVVQRITIRTEASQINLECEVIAGGRLNRSQMTALTTIKTELSRSTLIMATDMQDTLPRMETNMINTTSRGIGELDVGCWPQENADVRLYILVAQFHRSVKRWIESINRVYPTE